MTNSWQAIKARPSGKPRDYFSPDLVKEKNGYNFTRYFDSACRRCTPQLAIQLGMGVLSKWRPGAGSPDHHYPAPGWLSITR